MHVFKLWILALVLIACGADEPLADAGPAADGGRLDAALPDDLRACEVPSDCMVVPADCCGSCGEPVRGNALAIARDKASAHSEAVCRDDQGCPDCAALFKDPTLLATCRDARCELVDLREHDSTAGDSDAECMLRTPDCCPCGGDTTPGRVIAVTSENGYSALVCDPGQGCDDCLPSYPSEVTATCNGDGHCETEDERVDPSFVPDSGSADGVGCEVDGVVYPSGAGGIDDPVSCNSCECVDGALVCTEIACPEPCEEGTRFGMECAQCGPADGCEVVRFGCLPACEEPSECEGGGQCVDGVCRTLCG